MSLRVASATDYYHYGKFSPVATSTPICDGESATSEWVVVLEAQRAKLLASDGVSTQAIRRHLCHRLVYVDRCFLWLQAGTSALIALSALRLLQLSLEAKAAVRTLLPE